MPDVGSSYATVKRALRDRLQERSGLVGVAVEYQAPVQAADNRGSAGQYEKIFLDDVEDGELNNVVMCSVPLRLDESYHLSVVIEVIRPSSLGTQEAADERVDQLLFEIVHELASDPTLGISLNPGLHSHFDFLNVTRGRFVRDTGFIAGTGGGHGARCVLDVEVSCRLSFP